MNRFMYNATAVSFITAFLAIAGTASPNTMKGARSEFSPSTGKQFVLVNRHGLRAVVLEYGAILQSVETPDRAGKLADVTLGYDSPAGWRSSTSYFGAVVGRYANRIARGQFVL